MLWLIKGLRYALMDPSRKKQEAAKVSSMRKYLEYWRRICTKLFGSTAETRNLHLVEKLEFVALPKTSVQYSSGTVGKPCITHPLDLSETDQWEAICSEHVISFELLETRLADSCHQRRIYDVINHHSPCRRSCFRDRTKRMLRCVFARSFRERKLEFLSAQHVKLGFQVVLRENYPVLFAQNYQNKQKELRGLASGSLPWQYDQGTLQSSRPDRRGARRQGRATAAG